MALLLAAFVFVESRAPEPVLPLWIFRRRVLDASNSGAFVVGVLMLGLTSHVPLYAQGVLGHGALVAGLALAAMTTVFGAIVNSRLAGGTTTGSPSDLDQVSADVLAPAVHAGVRVLCGGSARAAVVRTDHAAPGGHGPGVERLSRAAHDQATHSSPRSAIPFSFVSSRSPW